MGITSLEYMLLIDCGAAVPVEGDELNKMKIVKKNMPPAALPVITARYNAQQRSDVLAPQKRATPSMQREIFLTTDVCHTVARSAVTNMPSDDRVACGNVGSL